MKWLGLHTRLRSLASTAFPSLRVIGMAYTGLIGVGAAALVVSVAFLPVPPVLQQATQPARDAVANLVQPATDVVTTLISTWPAPPEPRILVMLRPQVALASPVTVEEVVPEENLAPSADVQPVAVAAARVVTAPVTQLTLAPVVKISVSRDAGSAASAPVAEAVPADDPEPAVGTKDRPVREVAVVALAHSPVQQEASLEVPRPIEPVPSPTPEAAWQAKARLDVENQTAIDTAKVLLVRRKADADTANQAAIDVRKSTTDVAPTATPVETAGPARPLPALAQPTLPTAPATTPPTVVPTAADNQSLIDAARASKVRAKADANAVNQAAIDAARAPHSAVTPMPSPTLPPAVSTPTLPPAPTAEPARTKSVVRATAPVNVDVLSDPPSDVEEMPMTLALDSPQD